MAVAMVRSLVVVCLTLGSSIVGCGDNLPPTAIEADILAQLSVRVIGTLHPENDRGLAVAALEDTTIAVARASSVGATFCPECVGIDPALCPAICRRTRIAVEVHHATGVPDAAITIAQVFPRSADHSARGASASAGSTATTRRAGPGPRERAATRATRRSTWGRWESARS
jgi:hypothetical protein